MVSKKIKKKQCTWYSLRLGRYVAKLANGWA